VADSFESTKAKMSQLLYDHYSGRMEEDGSFTYRFDLFMSPVFYENSYQPRMVYGRGKLVADGKNTLIYFIISPNLILVFFILLISPIMCLVAIFDNQYLLPGGKHNIWRIIQFFLILDAVIFSMILFSTYILKQSFEKRFDLSADRR
jgi:hypothetical protein